MEIKWLNWSKFFLTAYLLYTYVFRQTLFPIPVISYLLLPAAVICFLLFRQEIKLDSFLKALILYTVYCTVSGFLLAKDTAVLLRACKNLALYTVVFWLTFEYSLEDKSIDFAERVLFMWTLSYTVMILLFGVGSERVSIAENVNVNGISRTMVFAIGLKLYQFTKGNRSRWQTIIAIVEIVLFLYVIAITVSKMAIICVLLLLLFWVLFCSAEASRDTLLKKLLFLIAAVAVATGLFIYFKTRFPERYAFILYRMSGLTGSNSSIKRWRLIKEALAVFSEHPLFGVGLNNFRFHTPLETYSHCLYTEVLSCTGTVGALMIFPAMGLLLVNLFRKVRSAPDETKRKQALLILFMYVLLLCISFVQIVIYSTHLMFVLAIINAAVYTELDKDGSR